MSRQNIYASEELYEADARRAVAHVVRFFRSLGHKNEHAIEMAAQALNLTPRRTWALVYPSQLVKVARVQRDLILHRWWAHMEREAAELRARAERTERTAEAERLAAAQLTLPLLGGAIECSSRSAPGSACGAGSAPMRVATRSEPSSGAPAGSG